ncbi:MAG: 23S rRNA (adenine(2030)-N(6))-methyltransferase RlmJ [Legionellaceae bacterium]|nr:23S rRNA (adenine(2030)-N(6))-methyltransferase RlmJ [Legionellaceae bacterium]
MLSYQHSYHAGCFADVVKHVVLLKILSYMVSKDKPMFYLETHAGRGKYDLFGKHSQKTGEAAQGIESLWSNKLQLPEFFSEYIQSIRNLNESENLRYYPGSPSFAIDMLRQQDRAFLCELHPGEFEYLNNLPHNGKKVFCSNSNGIEQLKSQLPPREKRGLIFIDPSFELKKEYITVPDAINAAYKRFSTGVYCLWYPLINDKFHEQLTRGLSKIKTNNYLHLEFRLNSTDHTGMDGCGFWIINPPYTLADEIKSASEVFKHTLNLTTYNI